LVVLRTPISGGNTTAELQGLKKTITSVFAEAKFTMYKWNSNDSQLESENVVPVDEQQSYAKQLNRCETNRGNVTESCEELD